MGSEATGSTKDLLFHEKLLDEPAREDVESDEEKNLSCNFCSEEFAFTKMYRCKTCTTDLATAAQTDVKGEHQVKIHYCTICIVGVHLRRKHEVVDYKGYEPAICENHKNICQYYCETCRSVFCADCTETHISHVFQLIEKKAVEVRPKVFEYMTTNEMLAKPLKHKQAITETCLKEISELRKSLGDCEINETLRKRFTRVISSSTTKWYCNLKDTLANETQSKNTFKVLESLNVESDKKDKKLKELLQMSDGNLVKHFIDSEDKIASSGTQEQKNLTSFTYLQWTNGLDCLIAKSVQETLKSVEIPRIENMEIKELELGLTENLPTTEREIDCSEMEVTDARGETKWDFVDELFELNISKGKCSFYLIKKEKENISSIHTVVLTNSTTVKYIFFKLGYVAICSTSGSVMVYCLHKNAFVYQFQLEQNCIPLSLHSWLDKTFTCLAWFDNVSRVQHTPTENGELLLPEKPTQFCQFVEIYSFAHSENTVTIWNRMTNAQLDISNLQHGLSSVGNMKLADLTTLFLFDYRLHLAVMFEFDLGTKSPRKCLLEKVLKISPFSTGPTKLMTVNCGRLFSCSCYDEIYSAEVPS